MISKASQAIATYLVNALVQHQKAQPLGGTTPPLFVGLQGPQGIGKTTLTASLQRAVDELSGSNDRDSAAFPTNPRLAILSLDDFYLPYEQLAHLASKPVSLYGSNSGAPDASLPNKLLKGRGQPGTHDVALLHDTLVELSSINTPLPPSSSGPMGEPRYASIRLPAFDKSLHSGMGDRASPETGPVLEGPVDIVILEGWCIGFYPQLSGVVSLWDGVVGKAESERPESDLERRVISSLGATLWEVEEINEHLKVYAELIYPFFTGFIQVCVQLGLS